MILAQANDFIFVRLLRSDNFSWDVETASIRESRDQNYEEPTVPWFEYRFSNKKTCLALC